MSNAIRSKWDPNTAFKAVRQLYDTHPDTPALAHCAIARSATVSCDRGLYESHLTRRIPYERYATQKETRNGRTKRPDRSVRQDRHVPCAIARSATVCNSDAIVRFLIKNGTRWQAVSDPVQSCECHECPTSDRDQDRHTKGPKRVACMTIRGF